MNEHPNPKGCLLAVVVSILLWALIYFVGKACIEMI